MKQTTKSPNTNHANVVAPPVKPASAHAAGEVQTSLSLVDFLATWYRLRGWFVGGFLLVALGTIIWNKCFMTKFYRAEARVFVGRAIPMEQRIGFSDLDGAAVGRNDQFLNLVQGVLAEQYLTSTNLLLEVTDGLLKGTFAQYGLTQKWDLYGLLKIREKNEDFRQRKLAATLQNDLIAVRQVQNSGLLTFSAELPDPEAARSFVNACVRVLQDRFTTLEFDYYDKARNEYKAKLDGEIKKSEELARARVGLEMDKYPPRAQQNEIVKAQLEYQATYIAELKTKISKLEMATSEGAKFAAQPVKVVDWAYTPLKKVRPKTTLNTLMAAALYTFIFMLGLAGYSYVRWSLAARREGETW
jgi:uncharacterized protein involved in exopolysaccharide biosynthesis